jgi:hypothetical protein
MKELENVAGSALVSGNQLRGSWFTALAEFFPLTVDNSDDCRFDKITFGNNLRDDRNAVVNKVGASVRLSGDHLVAVGNHVEGPRGVNGIALGDCLKVALMGNVSAGDYIEVGTVTPSPIQNFNVKI